MGKVLLSGTNLGLIPAVSYTSDSRWTLPCTRRWAPRGPRFDAGNLTLMLMTITLGARQPEILGGLFVAIGASKLLIGGSFS